MKKTEIIKLLDQEVGLFHKQSEQDSLGHQYLSNLQFKEVEVLLSELVVLKDATKAYESKLKDIVEGNDRFTVWKNIEETIKDKTIDIPFPLIILGASQVGFINCHLNHKKLPDMEQRKTE